MASWSSTHVRAKNGNDVFCAQLEIKSAMTQEQAEKRVKTFWKLQSANNKENFSLQTAVYIQGVGWRAGKWSAVSAGSPGLPDDYDSMVEGDLKITKILINRVVGAP